MNRDIQTLFGETNDTIICVIKSIPEKYWYPFIYPGRLIWVDQFMLNNHFLVELVRNNPVFYDLEIHHFNLGPKNVGPKQI